MTDEPAAWTRLLDAFDRELTAANDAPLEDVETPAGPPPAEVVERARLILERQRASISGLQAARDNIAREMQAIRRIPTTRADAPVYLDLDA